ncbi:hypothetical protein FAI40_06030 [Acetobacteraceae bacterium]|nr:hypothetical protein FAI40_06030 [Acetobacteraceae bacterium]
MTESPKVFDFEGNSVRSFHRISMSMRRKLDFARIKMSLEQWGKLSQEQRKMLFNAPCTGDAESSQHYAKLVREAVKQAAGEEVKALTDPRFDLWQKADAIPEKIEKLAKKMVNKEITLPQWKGLESLQRFALLKLSQSHRESEHVNFRLALKEFGLI